jgi:hypothetical protein
LLVGVLACEVTALAGCAAATSSAGVFAGSVTGVVLSARTNCLDVGPRGGSDFGGDDNKKLGNGIVCFMTSLGSGGRCLTVGSHTPGQQVAEELRFPVDKVTRGLMSVCRSLAPAA